MITTVSKKDVIERLNILANPEIAAHSQKFFKTGEGEYGCGDKFLGIRVPVIRKAVKRFKTLPLNEAEELLKSGYHEMRLFALLFFVLRFNKNADNERNTIFHIYINNTAYINNWDLVDSSAHYIVGAYLYDKDRSLLYKYAESTSLWERRIAIMSTFYYIKNNEFKDALKISKILLNDKEDLIHKAVGWMLREIGNRDKTAEVEFLNNYYRRMPRTMLRYAIEKFGREERQQYLKGEI